MLRAGGSGVDSDLVRLGEACFKEPTVLGGEESLISTSSLSFSFLLPFWSFPLVLVLSPVFPSPHPLQSPLTLPPHAPPPPHPTATLSSMPQLSVVGVLPHPPSVPDLLDSPLSVVIFQSFETLEVGDAAVASFFGDDCEPQFFVIELLSVFFEGESHKLVSQSFEGVLEGGPFLEPLPAFPGRWDDPD